MAEGDTGTPTQKIVIGLIFAAIGVFFLLVGFGFIPAPSEPNSPFWVVGVAGLIFFLAGAGVVLLGLAGANERSELPPEAPAWMHALQYSFVTAIFVCFAVIASWIAFGAGPRPFSGSFMLFSGNINATIGRAVFGFSAILLWICVLFLLGDTISRFKQHFRGE